ncbi:MAG TPA: hypothetical protein V6C69_01905 [Trichormus sp.]|jgi:hypothetical protein
MTHDSGFFNARKALVGDEIVDDAISSAARGANTPKAGGTAPYPWILHPVIDILFVCGGLMWLAIGAYFALNLHLDASTALVLTILCNLVTSQVHQPATLYRVYKSPRTRKQVGKVVTIWGVVVIALATQALFSPTFTGFLLLATLVWSLQHLLAQSYGIVLIYCYKRNYILSKYEKQSLIWLINSTIVYLIIRLFSLPITNRPIVGGNLPAWLGQLPDLFLTGATVALQIATVWFAFLVVRKWKREGKIFPLPALLTLCTSLMIPTVSANPLFAVLVQNLFHSTQYNVVTVAYYLKERGLPADLPLSQIHTQLLKKPAINYYCFLLVLGVTLSVVFPVCLVFVGFQATAATVCYCAVNLHHYFADAAIWKLRDPEVRKLLVS